MALERPAVRRAAGERWQLSAYDRSINGHRPDNLAIVARFSPMLERYSVSVGRRLGAPDP